MTTININVPNVTVIVNGDTIDINPSYQQGMSYPVQYGQQYPSWQGPNTHPHQHSLYPRPESSEYKPHQPNPTFGKGFDGPIYTDEALLNLFRSFCVRDVYMSDVSALENRVTLSVTTQSISLELIQDARKHLCLVIPYTDNDVTTSESTKTLETFCKNNAGLWLSKKEIVYLKPGDSSNKSA